MFVSKENTAPCFKDCTLVMPAVAVGNVGQLAADLLVSTLNMRLVGYLHTDCLLPLVGNNPYCTSDHQELHTAAEVYTAAERRLVVLQIRTPIVQTKSRSFRKQLLSWIRSSQFCRTVVVSSSHAHQRDDQQLQGAPLRYLATPALQKVCGALLEELGWTELERVALFPGVGGVGGPAEQRLYIPGGGITKGLFTDSCAEDLTLAVLLIFCSEGDNIPDAFTLLNHLNDWLHLVDTPSQGPNKWRIPASWRLLFGSGIPPALF